MAIQLSDHFTYPKLIRFVFPSIVMMIFTSIYGVVDGLFVSNFVGTMPFAAINLIWPVLMIQGAFGFMVGTGGSALVAKTLGEGKKELANQYFTMLLRLTLILGVLLSAVGIFFLEPICLLLGATPKMLGDCMVYGRIMLFFNLTFMLQNVFQSFFVTAEKPKLGLWVTVAAGFTNMVLDALFIVGFHWGVAGAALATVISQCVGGILPLLYFTRPNSSLLRITRTKMEFLPLWRACLNGSSELMTNISGSLVSMLYNLQLLKFAGENGVAAYGVIMYVQFIFIAIYFGYAIGSGPIISYHFGAGNRKELQQLLRKSLLLTLSCGIVLVSLAKLLASPLSAIFVGYDPKLLSMTTHALKLFSYSFLLAGLNIFASAFFTALNNGFVSAAISFLRTLVFQLFSVLILPVFFQLDGIWWAVTVAEILACLVSAFFLIKNQKRYGYF